ncbi:aminodeoxychorismate synthase component I [Schinkia azotoformans]|uniref:Para-aminobenzoate synthase subunit I n=1 Tax=Schinkia azotoformans LMG 9581 TaxID=1131731 RepID=K6C9S8_SCHAZ|nr:aminodeoxychorismate synthase component I [Schinkia azotoformans]EKN67890.1 para-aminobenzoate synthase subunit I [Schinkia azotoformans LMG 9581]MEC1637090.1 aminodeoxychorismate synthase component I [Schinkia azotoformans]MEC1945465.1 aminodeoxychorismate synthase component I [Schinkia azotoformans]
MQIENKAKLGPLLSFEYVDSSGEIQPLTFCNPQKIIVAHTMDEVLTSLQLVQDAVNKGFYAAGFLSYESAPAFDKALNVSEGHSMPLLWFGLFSEPQHSSLSSSGSYNHTQWQPSISMDDYQTAISAIKQFIASGDTYQVNYTIRLTSQFQGDDIALFEKLKKAQSSNYCAYINTGEHSIISASPELFFHLKEDRIITRPMKGTAKRGNSITEDEAIAKWLYHSEKNRAENVMIVDLLRNDLGMIAESGSVHVPKLFEIERYPTVHQMTSTITAKVSENTTLVDIFKALFPCGSITGAPKIRTMEIIKDLESTPREVYCGAIGFITPHKEAIFNVPIRTVVIEQGSGEAIYGVGGGVTWDSTVEGEYNEILEKASFLEVERPEFQLLESLLLIDGEYFLLEKHLNRLQNSAQYFGGFPFNKEVIQKVLQAFAKENNIGRLKVRFLLPKSGKMTIEASPIIQPEEPLKVKLADKPITIDNPFSYHKTTNRDVYTQFQKKFPDVFDVLLWNESGELTEFTNGNVVLEMDGQLWTPPITSGLLAGTFRESLIDKGEIQEKSLTLSDLKKCTKLWFINSVRKWVEVKII